MDIPTLSMALAQSDVAQNFSIGILSKSLESVEEMGDGLNKIMEVSVPPEVGGSVDILV